MAVSSGKFEVRAVVDNWNFDGFSGLGGSFNGNVQVGCEPIGNLGMSQRQWIIVNCQRSITRDSFTDAGQRVEGQRSSQQMHAAVDLRVNGVAKVKDQVKKKK